MRGFWASNFANLFIPLSCTFPPSLVMIVNWEVTKVIVCSVLLDNVQFALGTLAVHHIFFSVHSNFNMFLPKFWVIRTQNVQFRTVTPGFPDPMSHLGHCTVHFFQCTDPFLDSTFQWARDSRREVFIIKKWSSHLSNGPSEVISKIHLISTYYFSGYMESVIYSHCGKMCSFIGISTFYKFNIVFISRVWSWPRATPIRPGTLRPCDLFRA